MLHGSRTRTYPQNQVLLTEIVPDAHIDLPDFRIPEGLGRLFAAWHNSDLRFRYLLSVTGLPGISTSSSGGKVVPMFYFM